MFISYHGMCDMEQVGYRLYLLFIISWFLHFGRRVPIWGDMRLDLIIVIVLVIMCFILTNSRALQESSEDNTWKYLKILIAFIFITIPFVEWPGSVIKFGLENFVKAVVFYYFTVIFINTEKRLKQFISVFLGCQIFRIAEPLYLHITQGYWGSSASMIGAGGMEMMNRLAGAPHDVINPNGLAYLIVFILPIIHFLSSYSWVNRSIYLISLPILIYALFLTGSRSGFLALIIVVVGIIIKTKKKALYTGIILAASMVILLNLSGDLADRYLSIFTSDTKNAATAHQRITNLESDLLVALKKPIVGHGISTSIEANANLASSSLRSHNLYTELAQEIGFVGLVIFLLFMKAIGLNLVNSYKTLKDSGRSGGYLLLFNNAMHVTFAMNILFSIFSYGLSTFSWYLLAGLSVVLNRLNYKTT